VWPLKPAAAATSATSAAPAGAAPPAPAASRPNLTPPAGGGPAGAKPAGFDACTLVTQAEAEAVLGAPVVTTDNRPTACRYHAADGSSLGIDSAGGASAAYSQLMFTASHDIGSGITDIPGLGDKAYSAGEDPYCCALYVLKGSTLFEVVVTPFDRAFEHGAPTAKLLTLARAAASQL
jgi:hypothetical protein